MCDRKGLSKVFVISIIDCTDTDAADDTDAVGQSSCYEGWKGMEFDDWNLPNAECE